MDERTLTALQGSIEKWKKICDGTGTDEGASNCPLCRLFNTYTGKNDTRSDKEMEASCKGCPVYNSTGRQYCIGTPYGNYNDTARNSRDVANKMLNFLISLLPSQ